MPSEKFVTSGGTRKVVSILLVTHVLAILLPPLSLQSRGPMGISPLISTLMQPLEAYCQFLYIDRGYAFFAPDPGPSHLIQIRVEDANGESNDYLYPNLERQWPRLLYHRHFMLTEFLHALHRPKHLENAMSSEETYVQPLQVERDRYELVRDSYLRHLQKEFEGKRISIRRIEHQLPSYDLYMADPRPLNHPASYLPLPDHLGADVDVDLSESMIEPASSGDRLISRER